MEVSVNQNSILFQQNVATKYLLETLHEGFEKLVCTTKVIGIQKMITLYSPLHKFLQSQSPYKKWVG